MAIKVKAGTPREIHTAIPGGISTKAVVKEFDESEERSKTVDVPVKVGWYGRADRADQSDPTYVRKEYSPVPSIQDRERHMKDLEKETVRVLDAIGGTPKFINAMGKGYSAEETSQVNPFEFPAAGSTKPKTLSESIQEVALRFKLLMVALWLPKDYRVLPPQAPMPDPMMVDLSVELRALARKLWDSYEPLLGAQNTVSVLQMEAPPEEDDDG